MFKNHNQATRFRLLFPVLVLSQANRLKRAINLLTWRPRNAKYQTSGRCLTFRGIRFFHQSAKAGVEAGYFSLKCGLENLDLCITEQVATTATVYGFAWIKQRKYGSEPSFWRACTSNWLNRSSESRETPTAGITASVRRLAIQVKKNYPKKKHLTVQKCEEKVIGIRFCESGRHRQHFHSVC